MAAKTTEQDNWNIYEIGVDGSGLRQITRGLGDCRRPSYQSRFYQISDAERRLVSDHVRGLPGRRCQ